MIAIYKITNRLNGKPYIGQTRQPIEKRFIQHSKAQTPLGQAMRQCGLENFTIEVIEMCETQAQANEREPFWIKVLKCKIPNGYKQRNGGGCFLHKPRPYDMCGMEKSGIGKKLRERRSELSLTQRQVAIFVGVTEATVSRWESGDIDNMRRDKIARLAEVLRVSPLLIMGDENFDRTHIPPTAEELNLIDIWRTLEIDDKDFVMLLMKRLSVPVRSTKGSPASPNVTQKNYKGNNYYGINDGNFNSNVSE
ncbi:MAG: helix-turn-helix domain-containing protein [Selenomonadaceae bacterium]|nr:helix-turn-helix domain-containing protein [Selenomonadaceae bacterium]MBR4384633.1 helix-turn-helix domain-containing protein [Selenomonadaceae bacterium]